MRKRDAKLLATVKLINNINYSILSIEHYYNLEKLHIITERKKDNVE